MQFLKTLFWVVLAVVAVVFAMHNWTSVTLVLSGGYRLDVKLPILLLLVFLAGFAPTAAVLGASRWRLRRRLESAERALADVRAAEPAAPPPPLPPPHRPIQAGPAVEP